MIRQVKLPRWRRHIIAAFCSAIILSGSFPALPANAIVNGDGLVVYGEGTVQTPRWRSWTNPTNTFGTEASLPTVNGAIHQIQIATAPNRQEAVALTQNDGLFNNQLRAAHYNGSSWTAASWQASIGFNTSAPRFDVVYSQSTNKAFAVYSANASSTNEIRYRTFDGTTWSAEQSYNTIRTSNNVAFIKAVARPGTDEIAVIWGDDTNLDMSANYYDMGTNTWGSEPSAALSADVSRAGSGTSSINSAFADAAFEQVSGELLVCWGHNATVGLKCIERTAGTSGSWGTTFTNADSQIEPVELHMASEPGSNYIAYTTVDDAGTPSGEAGIWNGSSWGNYDRFSTTNLNTTDQSTTNTAVAWVRNGIQSRAVVTFDDRLVSGVDWRVFNKNTGSWSAQTPYTGTPTASNFNDRMHTLVANPHNPSQLMFLHRDNNDDLFAKKVVFDGTDLTWSSVEPGGVAIETTLTTRSLGYGWQVDFAYYDQPNAPALTFTQSSFRLFSNTDSTDVGAVLGPVNNAVTLGATGDAFRLRQNISVSGGALDVGAQYFKLQYAGRGAGTCAAPSGTPSSYTDVTTGTAIAFKDNPTPVTDSPLTANANDPSHTVNESYVEANEYTSVTQIGSGQSGMWDFSLYDNGAPGGTAYCFRTVKSGGSALNTYTNYAQITTTTVPTNTDPNVPASLAQTKTSTAALATGDWTNENTVRFTGSLSDPDSSDTLQLCVEIKPIGTAFDSNDANQTCGTGVAYSGSAVPATVTVGSLSDGTQYHWQARTKDAAGAYSAWQSYGGNAESARDVGVDTSAPSGGTVFDGTAAGVDAMFNDGSLSTLSANWSGFNTNASGLARYEYAIGTTPGGSNVKGWTNNGTTTSVTANGLTLRTSQTYYVSVRAVDNAGNTQTAVASDGQLILPSLSFGISSSTVDFANLNANNGYTDTKSTTVTTSTNAYGGYVVRAYMPGAFEDGPLAIPDFTGGSYAAPDAWQTGDIGFGYTSNDTSVQGSNIFQSSTCPGGSALAAPGCFAPFSHSGPGDIIADHTATVDGSPITNEAFQMSYKVAVDPMQPASSWYQATIVYSVTPSY